MKYIPPQGGAPDDAYVNHNINEGVEGSIPLAEAFEHPQREIVHAIEAAGMIPDPNDLYQLSRAMGSRGAYIIENVTFEASVVEGDIVYYDAPSATYKKALAPGTKAAGVADVANSRLYVAGQLPDNFFTGLFKSRDYFLSDTVAGGKTPTEQDIFVQKIGTALADNKFYLDIAPYDEKLKLLWDLHFLGFRQSQIFDINGTYQVPANVDVIRVTAFGAGGGGGGTDNAPAAAGGGGRGGYGRAIIRVTPGDQFTVTIGAGGTGGQGHGSLKGVPGQPGGNSIFLNAASAPLITCTGGGGGNGADTNSSTGPGLGGYVTFDTTKIFSSDIPDIPVTLGTSGVLSGSIGGTGGGFNGGGGLPTINGGSFAIAGDGTTPGSGGGGGGGNSNSGGNGANGQIIVEW